MNRAKAEARDVEPCYGVWYRYLDLEATRTYLRVSQTAFALLAKLLSAKEFSFGKTIFAETILVLEANSRVCT
jgi:hypothetical protein